MVTDQNKFANGIFSIFTAGTEDAQQLRLQNLSGFIHDGYIELFQAKEFGLTGNGGHCPYKDTAVTDALGYFGPAEAV